METQTKQFTIAKKIAETWLAYYDPANEAKEHRDIVYSRRIQKLFYAGASWLSALGIPAMAGYSYGLKGIVLSLIGAIPAAKALYKKAQEAEEYENQKLKDQKKSQELVDSYDFSFLPKCKTKKTIVLRDKYCAIYRGYEELKKATARDSTTIKNTAQSGMTFRIIGGMNAYYEDMETIKSRLEAIRYAEQELPNLEKTLRIQAKVKPRTPFMTDDLETILTKSASQLRSKEDVERTMRAVAAMEMGGNFIG